MLASAWTTRAARTRTHTRTTATITLALRREARSRTLRLRPAWHGIRTWWTQRSAWTGARTRGLLHASLRLSNTFGQFRVGRNDRTIRRRLGHRRARTARSTALATLTREARRAGSATRTTCRPRNRRRSRRKRRTVTANRLIGLRFRHRRHRHAGRRTLQRRCTRRGPLGSNDLSHPRPNRRSRRNRSRGTLSAWRDNGIGR